jgi:hypothetical protein
LKVGADADGSRSWRVRMRSRISSTFFESEAKLVEDIVGEVDRGYRQSEGMGEKRSRDEIR